MNEETKTIRINDKEYLLSDLSNDAKAQLSSLHITDVEIKRLKAQLAIHETARNAYARALDTLLPKTAQ
jgi:hypothetical protein